MKTKPKKNYWTLSFMSAHFSNNLSLCSFCFWLSLDPCYTFFSLALSFRTALCLFFSFSLDMVLRSYLYLLTFRGHFRCSAVYTAKDLRTVWRWKRLFLWWFLLNVTTASTNRDSHAIRPCINLFRFSFCCRRCGLLPRWNAHNLDEPHIHL